MRKHSYLLSAIVGIIVLAMLYNYWRIFIRQDYVLADFVSCDPITEDCFVNTCDDCDEIPQYFKIIEKRAYNVKGCDFIGHNCLPFTCENNDPTCQVVYCSDKKATLGYPCEEITE